MNILFLSQASINNLESHNIYSDLLNEFIKRKHKIYIATPVERRLNEQTQLNHHNGYTILKVKTGNLQKTNIIEKGISTVTFENLFIKATKKYYYDVHFDLVLYATPPITMTKVIKYIKRKDCAKTYLLLKDIFPQNAVDLQMFRKANPVYLYFRAKEMELYRLSDYIGCMSRANVNYLLEHNGRVKAENVEVCPNSIVPLVIETNNISELRNKYNLPINEKIFVYGGNLGKPQGVEFICKCLKECRDLENAYFLIVGSGTEYNNLKNYIEKENLQNVMLINQLPKEDYDSLVSSCDVGLIFLDHRFTIPNFPSRLLSYMQAKMPVLACTDTNTDIGRVIEKGQFGYWCGSNDSKVFKHKIETICHADLYAMGQNAWNYLNEHYTVEQAYSTIMRHFE